MTIAIRTVESVEDTPAKTAVETETRKVHNNYSGTGLSLHILPSWEAQDYTSYSSGAPEDVKTESAAFVRYQMAATVRE